MAYFFGGFIMFHRSVLRGFEFSKALATLVSRLAIVINRLPYRSDSSSRKLGADIRCTESVLEPSNANTIGHWYPTGSKQSEAEIEFLAGFLSYCDIVEPKVAANRALNAFGSIPKFFDASPTRLKSLGFDSPYLVRNINLIKTSLEHYLKPTSIDPLNLKTFQKLIEYLIFHHRHLNVEHARVLFLDSTNNLLDDQLLFKGTNDQCALYTREVMYKAMDLGAAAIILAHNHPGSDEKASRQDIQLTRDICDAGRKLGIAVHDHIIISGSNYYSFRSAGLM